MRRNFNRDSVPKQETTMTKNNSDSPISMGKLQAQMETSAKAHRAAERALKRAQEARDVTQSAASAARQAFVDATRAVLG